MTPTYVDDFSATITQMRQQTDPGEVGSEALATSLGGELERLRKRIAEISGETYWYSTGTGIRAQPFTTAGLPAPSIAGRLATLTDGLQGLYLDNGSLWVPVNYGGVNVKQHGAKGDGVTDDTTAINTAKTAAVAAGAPLIFPPGTYLHTGFSVTTSNFKMIGMGNAILKHTGSGNALSFDGSSGAIYNCSIANITVQGNINTTNAFNFVACHHVTGSDLHARDCVTGFNFAWVIEGVWNNLTCSVNEGAFSVLTPTQGITIQDTNPGYYCVNNVFFNATLEGINGRGIYIINGANNTFVGGTSEANLIGIEIAEALANDCRRNSFHDFWCEQNSQRDVDIYGDHNEFSGCYLQSNNASFTNVNIHDPGRHNVFRKCAIKSTDDKSANTQTYYYDCVFPDSGSPIINPAYSKLFNCRRYNASAVYTTRYYDNIHEQGNFTPSIAGGTTAGVFTYGTRTGTYNRIGNMVTVAIRIAIVGITTPPTGIVTITGLPFSVNSFMGDFPVAVGEFHEVNLPATGYTTVGGNFFPNSATIRLTTSGFDLPTVNIDSSSVASNTFIGLTATYIAA